MKKEASWTPLWTPEAAAYDRPTMEEIRERPKTGLVGVGSFSGCGGSSLGLRMAGFDVRYAIEFVEAAASTYVANLDGYVDSRDIREVDPDEILERTGLERGALDLFEGSPPCASFSTAGKREKGWGETKKYSETTQRTDDLFWEWTRLLDGLLPRAFVAENVPGMLNGSALDEYARKIVGEFGRLGYRANSYLVNAASYGVPQNRKRLIFLGIRKDVGDDLPRPPVATTPDPLTLRAALDSVVDEDPADLDAASMERFAVGTTWKVYRDANVAGREPDFKKLPCGRCGEPLYRHRGVVGNDDGTIRKATCEDGEAAEIVKDYFMLTLPDLDFPCPTITATAASPGAASVSHPTECRKFTPRECLAIAGFPPDFELVGDYSQRVERIGRAVPPPLYEAIGHRLTEYLSRPSLEEEEG